MKKRSFMKKLIATAGAAAMALTLMIPAGTVRAAGETINPDTPVTLTITKYEGDNTGLSSDVSGKQDNSISGNTIADVEFTAVKIATIDQETTAENSAVKYKLTDAGASLTGIGNEGDAKTATEINTWLSGKTANDLTDDVESAAGAVSGTTDSNGVLIFTSNAGTTGDNVKQISGQGLYLVVETKAPATVTKRSVPFVVSLPMTDKENGNGWMYDVYAYPKNSISATDVEKEISAINGASQDAGIAADKKSAEAQIGDEITYQVPITAIVPDSGLTRLGITDIMSKGLTFVKAGDSAAPADVDVYAGASTEAEKVDEDSYTVSAETDGSGVTTLKVYFTETYLGTLNSNTSDREHEFLFVYKAKLNEDAVLGTTGNGNSVKMTYNYNNGPDSDVESGSKEAKVYTWGIDLTKKGEDNSALQGVEFNLAKDNETLAFVYDSDSNAYRPAVAEPESTSETLTTVAGGKLYIRGLESGTYTLTETKTVNGYTLLKNPITIVITGNNTDGSARATVDGEEVTLTQDNVNNGSNSALIPLTVVNSKGFDLPQTGAAGTAIFAIAGVILIAAAGMLLVLRRKSGK